jgi:hypothetical protein
MMQNENENNLSIFRECVSDALIQRSLAETKKQVRRRASEARKQVSTSQDDEDETSDLAEFADVCTINYHIQHAPFYLFFFFKKKKPNKFKIKEQYIATELFTSFPSDFQTLSYPTIQKSLNLTSKYTSPLPETTLTHLLSLTPPSIPDSLHTYAFLTDPSSLPNFLLPILNAYIGATTAAPPPWSSTRTSACEICERDWIPLTYHHLIPKETHAKVMKRGWHEEWELNRVAWLCGACHRFVHACATNEELAREWWSVERLMMREDVRDWARWRGGVRWKKK